MEKNREKAEQIYGWEKFYVEFLHKINQQKKSKKINKNRRWEKDIDRKTAGYPQVIHKNVDNFM